jgi:hypothetical protein
LVQTGDEVTLDVPGRTLTVEVSEKELQRRRPNAATLDGFADAARGWERLYIDHVQQADTGTDLDFLVGATGDRVSRDPTSTQGVPASSRGLSHEGAKRKSG